MLKVFNEKVQNSHPRTVCGAKMVTEQRYRAGNDGQLETDKDLLMVVIGRYEHPANDTVLFEEIKHPLFKPNNTQR